ncbi:MAG: exonuclease SbcCD subunit D [Lachnospiraceae bacterium]|nr:exonuclease SbcCD subunit D [Lachnospiraceae bacterium]
MKLLHTSDWHLGIGFRGADYEEDQRFAIDEICRVAEKEQVDGILLAGDVFDKSIASREAISLYNETMTRICRTMKLPVYMIAGNHDGAERLSQCSELLKNSGLYIAGALTREVQSVNIGDVDIYFLPWVSTDKVKSVFPERAEEADSIEKAYSIVLDEYRKKFVEGHKHILIAHAYIVNAQTSESDRSAVIGTATMVSASVFDGFDYVALGHLHGPQQITETICYSGTPMAYSFGTEEKQQKGVVILDTDTMKTEVVPLKQLHKRTTLRGTYEELLKADYDEDILKGYVRLEVTDRYIGKEARAVLEEKYENLLEVNGKNLERENDRITMTLEELKKFESDPEMIFINYCKDVLEEEATEHLKELFRNAVENYAKGENEE